MGAVFGITLLSIVLGIWLLVYGIMEIMAGFRLRGLAHSASRPVVHAH